MSFEDRYLRQVRLLVDVLRFVAEEKCFALNGGTAINLFVRAMPRLSVDIDLTYLPVEDRDTSLRNVEAALRRIGQRIHRGSSNREILYSPKKPMTRFDVRSDVTIKVEVSPVTRGCLFAPEMRGVRSIVEEQFGFAEVPVVSFADLYAGKIRAALDRQHPRDWYDVMLLLDTEGFSRPLMQALLVDLGKGDGMLALSGMASPPTTNPRTSLARLRRRTRQQDSRHPAQSIRTQRRRVSSPQNPHLHAPAALIPSKITHSITR